LKGKGKKNESEKKARGIKRRRKRARKSMRKCVKKHGEKQEKRIEYPAFQGTTNLPKKDEF
jgi:hypothetical protein